MLYLHVMMMPVRYPFSAFAPENMPLSRENQYNFIRFDSLNPPFQFSLRAVGSTLRGVVQYYRTGRSRAGGQNPLFHHSIVPSFPPGRRRYPTGRRPIAERSGAKFYPIYIPLFGRKVSGVSPAAGKKMFHTRMPKVLPCPTELENKSCYLSISLSTAL